MNTAYSFRWLGAVELNNRSSQNIGGQYCGRPTCRLSISHSLVRIVITCSKCDRYFYILELSLMKYNEFNGTDTSRVLLVFSTVLWLWWLHLTQVVSHGHRTNLLVVFHSDIYESPSGIGCSKCRTCTVLD